MFDTPNEDTAQRLAQAEAPGVTIAPREPHRWKLLDLVLFLTFAAIWLLLSPLVAYIGYAVLRPIVGWEVSTAALPQNASFAVVTQTIYYLPILAYVYFLVVFYYQQPFWYGLMWRNLSWPQGTRCFMGGIALALFTLLALALLPDKQSFPLEQLFSSPRAAYVVGGFAVLVAPFMEEIIFRGVLFAFLENLVGSRFAIVTTALLFAALHLPEYWGAWHHAALIVLVGAVFSVTRGITGSLTPSVILHFAYNTTLMTGLFIGTQQFQGLERGGAH